MNSNRTHLTIEHNKIKYIFTGTYNQCDLCRIEDYVITVGTNKNYDGWVNYCRDHLPNMVCKKQLCNLCNPKSVIKTNPKICIDCSTEILENNKEMCLTCNYPNVPRSECLCKYCKMVL